ncbi:MAG: 4Fe-4S binding protein [Anaerovoracaceae bacterium]
MRVKAELCRGCKMCQRYCKVGAIVIEGGVAKITDKCVGCRLCISACTFGAIEWD